jgi:ribosomal protein S18 acetylase RimI-like enzyme
MPMQQPAPDQIAIRRCTPMDTAVLAALARRTFYDTFTGTCTEDDMQHFLYTFYNEERIASELSREGDYTFLAELDGKPIGFLRFGEVDVPFSYDRALKPLELNRLYVDKAYKGLGLGPLLMDFYMSYAREHGYNFLWLGVWEHNYRAQAFYKKYGFSFSGHRHPFPIGNTPQTDEWWTLITK